MITKTLTHKQDEIYMTEYKSMGEFLHDLSNKPVNKFFKNDESNCSSKKGSYSFTKTYSYEEALKLAETGWQVAAEKMASKVKLSNSNSGLVRSTRPSYGVVGGQASIPRYLQGIPTNMVSRQMTYSKQKIVTITKDIAYNCGVTTSQIIEESIKALQIIQSMETQGQRVRLNVVWAVSEYHNGHSVYSICKVCIKQPEERLNISKLSFALAHPSMLRRIMFRYLETQAIMPYGFCYGYGSPAGRYLESLEVLDKNEYFIPAIIHEPMDEFIKKFQK